jgi:hypothetical protein
VISQRVAIAVGTAMIALTFLPSASLATPPAGPKYLMGTTAGPTLPSATCGPYSSPNATLYCATVSQSSLSCTITNSANFVVGAANGQFLYSTSYYFSNVGLGIQFLPITWDAGSPNDFYVISLIPSQTFYVQVYC